MEREKKTATIITKVIIWENIYYFFLPILRGMCSSKLYKTTQSTETYRYDKPYNTVARNV